MQNRASGPARRALELPTKSCLMFLSSLGERLGEGVNRKVPPASLPHPASPPRGRGARERAKGDWIMPMTNRLYAEFLGTAWLVLGGCGSAVLAAAFPQLGIGFAA